MKCWNYYELAGLCVLMLILAIWFFAGQAAKPSPVVQVVPACPRKAYVDVLKCKRIEGEQHLYLCQDVKVEMNCSMLLPQNN